MSLKVTFLGTGSSHGIPFMGLDHPVCHSQDPKDKRLRTSALVEVVGQTFLIDCGPDVRAQLLACNCGHLDALFLTHEHADHTAGFDELRSFTTRRSEPLPIYGYARTLKSLQQRFGYAFGTERYDSAPKVKLIEINEQSVLPFNNFTLTPVLIDHGPLPILGFQFGKFAYITDAKTIRPEEMLKIQGIDVLVLNALQIEAHKTHLNLEECLETIDRLKPKKAYLTHISHKLGFHQEVQSNLPKGVFLAYDGLEITI